MSKIRPLNDRLIVKRDDADNKIGLVIVPDTAKQPPLVGMVIAVGPGNIGEDGKRTPLDVKEGDSVIFRQYGGTEIEIEGEKLLILAEADVLGVLVPAAAVA